MNFLCRYQIISAVGISSLLLTSAPVFAGAFQLWEQDGASIGTYHAGYAALANDASTAFYNPAGMMRIKNQQIVLGGVTIVTDFKFKGAVAVTELGITQSFGDITTQGGNISPVPAFHFVTPLTERTAFGLSVDVPFGLKTDYGKETDLRYAATRTAITVVDISPSFAVQATDQFSLGAGFDIQKVSAEFNSVATLVILGPMLTPSFDTTSTNQATGTGYGYHLGALYQFSPDTRAGISYHSQVVHHLSGTSKFEGPIAESVNNGDPMLSADRSTVNITLPPYTALSAYHRIHSRVAIMGSAIYTQWAMIKNLILNGIAGAVEVPGPDLGGSTGIQVVIPQYFKNTWNLSVGTEFDATDKIILRGGVGYDQSPVRNAYRNVQLPDNDRYIIALGGHYQATKTIGVDVGWAHLFINSAEINPPPQVMGGESVMVNGRVQGGADVYGMQLTWDIA
jgi:long-chain fatty acid transport protein